MNKKDPVDFDGMTEELPEDALSRLAELARQQIELEDQIADLAAQMKEKGAELRRVSEDLIPSLLDDTGLSEVRLANGAKIVVRDNLRVSTTGKYRSAINAWLEKNGYADIIKDEVTVAFGRGQGSLAGRLIAWVAAEMDLPANRKRYVNPQTFGALLRELMESGAEVPLEELGAFAQRIAKIERP